jgi:hypothetical protein
MTSYITITDAETDPEAPLTATLAKKWRDNPIAIAEGDATAPSILPAIANKSSAGGVGTYMFATRTTGTTDVAFGATLAGSSLSPVSATYYLSDPINGKTTTLSTGSAQSGTWRCMGTFDYSANSSGTNILLGATLWLRIS